MRLILFFISHQDSKDGSTRHDIESRAGLVSLFSQCWARVWSRPVVALHELVASSQRHLPSSNADQEQSGELGFKRHAYLEP